MSVPIIIESIMPVTLFSNLLTRPDLIELSRIVIRILM